MHGHSKNRSNLCDVVVRVLVIGVTQVSNKSQFLLKISCFHNRCDACDAVLAIITI
jgi:hypothetical protein